MKFILTRKLASMLTGFLVRISLVEISQIHSSQSYSYRICAKHNDGSENSVTLDDCGHS